MNSTLATEPAEKTVTRSPLETWGKNERMRHVPPLGWMIEKLDFDLRRRIEKLLASIASQPPSEAIDAEVRALGRAIDRLADAAKFSRATTQAPAETSARIAWSINHAMTCLGSLDPNLFGRRHPFHSFERSKSEPVWGAFLVVIDHVHRLTALVRAIDSRIDERLLEGLVVLQEPLREQRMA
jgi:hypothetical protein